MRKIGSGRGQITAYPRQLESLIRLSEAHARMRFSDTVELQDVEEAARLHREALKQSATDPTTGRIDVSILTTGQVSSYLNLIILPRRNVSLNNLRVLPRERGDRRLRKLCKSYWARKTKHPQSVMTNSSPNLNLAAISRSPEKCKRQCVLTHLNLNCVSGMRML